MNERKRRLSAGAVETRFPLPLEQLALIQSDISVYRAGEDQENPRHVQLFHLVRIVWRFNHDYSHDVVMAQVMRQLIERTVHAKRLQSATTTYREMCRIADDYEHYCFSSHQSQDVIDSAVDLSRDLDHYYSVLDAMVQCFVANPHVENANQLTLFLDSFVSLLQQKDDIELWLHQEDHRRLAGVMPAFERCFAQYGVFSHYLSGLADQNTLVLFFGEAVTELEGLQDEANDVLANIVEADEHAFGGMERQCP